MSNGWTYLDPALEDPEPQVCHGRHKFQTALERQAEQGLKAELEEVAAVGDRVMVVVRTPGIDAFRRRKADDRRYALFTVRDGRIVAMRDCRDREEARRRPPSNSRTAASTIRYCAVCSSVTQGGRTRWPTVEMWFSSTSSPSSQASSRRIARIMLISPAWYCQ